MFWRFKRKNERKRFAHLEFRRFRADRRLYLDWLLLLSADGETHRLHLLHVLLHLASGLLHHPLHLLEDALPGGRRNEKERERDAGERPYSATEKPEKKRDAKRKTEN